MLLLYVAQWDVCCDDDDAAAAAQSEAQAQVLFQGLGSCLGFMNEERLSIPRVRPLSLFVTSVPPWPSQIFHPLPLSLV